jgi:predicted nucleotidyltransferase
MMALGQYKNGLKHVLQKNIAVKKFYLFGWALTPRFDETSSDIDVLVETEDLRRKKKASVFGFS